MYTTPLDTISRGAHTDNSAALISALIRMARPATVVQIGTGDSTIYIAKALEQAHADWQCDKDLLDSSKWQACAALLDPTGIPDAYRPRLIIVDEFTAEDSSARDARNAVKTQGIGENIVTFVTGNVHALNETTIEAWGPLDMAWIDAGTPADDVRFVAALWEYITPGGFLCLHEPTILVTVDTEETPRVRRIRSPVWEELFHRLDESFELITLPEPHRYRLSGLGIIRKRPDNERIFRSQSLQSALLELGELPIRSDYLPVAKATLCKRLQKDAISALMTSRESRSVYASIVLGARSLIDIVSKSNIDVKRAQKAVTRLLSLGLIQCDDGGLFDVDAIWENAADKLNHTMEDLSDRQLESEYSIERIATAFSLHTDYTEAEVSKICFLFTADYARLRRHLIDKGVLQRRNDIYRRVDV